MKESSVAVPMTLYLVGYGLFSVVAPTLLIIGVVQEAEQRDGDARFVAAGVTALTGAVMGTAGLVMLIGHAQDKESKAYVAKKQVSGLRARDARRRFLGADVSDAVGTRVQTRGEKPEASSLLAPGSG